jgi:hypothetical protein
MKYIKLFENFLILEDNSKLIQSLNQEKKAKTLNGVEFYVYPMNVLRDSDTTKLSGSKFKVKIVESGEIHSGGSNTLTIKPKFEVSDVQLSKDNNEENEYLQGDYGMLRNFDSSKPGEMKFMIMVRDSSGSGRINELMCDYPNTGFVIDADNDLIPALNKVFNTEFKVTPFEGDKKFVKFQAK